MGKKWEFGQTKKIFHINFMHWEKGHGGLSATCVLLIKGEWMILLNSEGKGNFWIVLYLVAIAK